MKQMITIINITKYLRIFSIGRNKWLKNTSFIKNSLSELNRVYSSQFYNYYSSHVKEDIKGGTYIDLEATILSKPTSFRLNIINNGKKYVGMLF